MNNDFSQIFTVFTTRQELNNFINQLDELAGFLYNVNVNLEQKISELIPMHKQQALQDFFAKQGITTSNKDHLEKFIKDFKDNAKLVPTLTLYVSFDPTEVTLNSVSNWVNVNTGKKVLIDIVIRQSLLGGALIEYNGVYKDYSLKKKFRTLWQSRNFVAEMTTGQATPDSAHQPTAQPVPPSAQQ